MIPMPCLPSGRQILTTLLIEEIYRLEHLTAVARCETDREAFRAKCAGLKETLKSLPEEALPLPAPPAKPTRWQRLLSKVKREVNGCLM